MIVSVNIDNLRIHGYHGVLPQERIVGHDFEVSLRMEVEYDGTDFLHSTVNYAEVAEVVASTLARPSQLLEYAALRAGRALRTHFPLIRGGELTLAKLSPPISRPVGRVSVTVPL